MAITIPTVDEFTESTVMLVIREIAEYICGNNGLVAQINNNDITGFTSSYTNNVLKIDATKGDGSKLPVCNVAIEGGGSSTGNPYPTAVSMTLSGTTLNFNMTMSNGTPITGSVNLAPMLSGYATDADVSGLKLSEVSPNGIALNGDSVTVVRSVAGSVSGSNLIVNVNGVASQPIVLPSGGGVQPIPFSSNSTLLSNGVTGDIVILNSQFTNGMNFYQLTLCGVYTKQPISETIHDCVSVAVVLSSTEVGVVYDVEDQTLITNKGNAYGVADTAVTGTIYRFIN